MEHLNFDKIENPDETVQQCIQDCLECYQECTSCLPHCMSLGGKHADKDHLTIMMECANLCSLSATLLQLEGKFAYDLCQLCAKACDACADACKEIGGAMMERCVYACRGCAESCRSMVRPVFSKADINH